MNANAALPDYRQQFSRRTIKNYFAAFLSPFGYNGFSTMLFSTYISFVYTEYLGVNAAAIASVVSIGVIVDGVTDFLMGMVMDRVITKWGKVKHWFFISALPVAVSMYLIWAVPASATHTFKLVWAFISYNLFCTLLTTVRMPAQTLPALVTDSDKVRTNLAWISALGIGISSAAIGWIVAPMLGAMGENIHTFRVISVICAVGTVIVLVVSGFLTKEQRDGEEWKTIKAVYAESNGGRKESIGQQFANLVKNKYYFRYLLINILQGAGTYFIFGVMAYWVQFVAKDMSKIGIITTAMNIPNLVGAVLYIVAAKKLTSKQICLYSIIVQAVCAVIMWIAGAKMFTLLVVLMFVKSFFGGITTPTCLVIIPQIADYGEWKTGSRQEGLTASGFAVLEKIVIALATAITGFVLSANGYEGSGVASAQAVSAINFLFLGLPAIFLILGAFSWLLYDLDESKMEQYRAEVEARKAAVRQESEEK